MTEQRSYSDAHTLTTDPLMRAQNLLRALYELAVDDPVLSSGEPRAMMFLDLIITVEDKVRDAVNAHEAEHAAAVREICGAAST